MKWTRHGTGGRHDQRQQETIFGKWSQLLRQFYDPCRVLVPRSSGHDSSRRTVHFGKSNRGAVWQVGRQAEGHRGLVASVMTCDDVWMWPKCATVVCCGTCVYDVACSAREGEKSHLLYVLCSVVSCECYYR